MSPVSLWPDPNALGLVTDLYQITMMAGYAATGLGDEPAVFELFVRRLPPHRSYLVFAGLEQALGDLLRLGFSDEQVAYVQGLPAFRHVPDAWFERLRAFRFTGNVWAMREGTVCFASEPFLRVEAPLEQAQLVETFLLASLSYPTLVASKAMRCVQAAQGRALYDFGARRGHGPHSGFLCARAAYLAGFAGTSHVEAARRLSIPAVGTMAHSWVQAFATEADAFAAYAKIFPESSTLLVDTYDTLEGVRHAASVREARSIRLDSGDLGALAREARAVLDGAGRSDMTIFASGDLDEGKIRDLLAAGAPIDAFGVGTELITSRDAPALSMVYKLVELAGQGRIKLAPGKKTYPRAKQAWRQFDERGRMAGDFVTRSDEVIDGVPLLRLVVQQGRLVGDDTDLPAARRHALREREALPDGFGGLDESHVYPMHYSESLEEEAIRAGVKVR
jgi:nicotinate phosphoribosyltransferase